VCAKCWSFIGAEPLIYTEKEDHQHSLEKKFKKDIEFETWQ
jgi:hypothetical protein